ANDAHNFFHKIYDRREEMDGSLLGAPFLITRPEDSLQSQSNLCKQSNPEGGFKTRPYPSDSYL
ncbi:MAG TPA: hypothetical protein VFQ89_04225, partial [Candidatus Binatia bacterium]|nr:hypothetical protein [Candidatus Binatia bacterium]